MAAISRLTTRGQHRRALQAALDSSLQARSIEAVSPLVTAAIATGEQRAAMEAIATLRDRRQAEALDLALADLHLAEGDPQSALALSARPRTDFAAWTYSLPIAALAGLAMGDRSEVFNEVGASSRSTFRGPAELRDPAILGDRHYNRLARLQGVALPAAARRSAWRLWQNARRSGSGAGQASALTILSALDVANGATVRSQLLAATALRLAARAGEIPLVYLAASQTASGAGRLGGARVCGALTNSASWLGFDCWLTEARRSWLQGRVAYSRDMIKRIVRASSSTRAHPVIAARLAEVAAPILRLYRDWPLFDRVLIDGLQAARSGGRQDLVGVLSVELASSLRLRGRPHDALAVAEEFPRAVASSVAVRLDLERARVARDLGRDREARKRFAAAKSLALRQPQPSQWLALLAGLESGYTDAAAWSELMKVPTALPPGPMGEIAAELTSAIRAESRGEDRTASASYARTSNLVRTWIHGQLTLDAQLFLQETWAALGQHRAHLYLKAGDAVRALEALQSGTASPGMSEPSATHLRGHLGRTDRLLVFGSIGPTLWVWVMDRDSVETLALSTPVRPLRELADLLAESLQSAAPLSHWAHLARSLAAKTIGEVAATGLIDDARTLVVVPSGGLRKVALDALPDPSTPGAYLGDRYVFVRGSSMAEIDRAWHQPRREPRAVAFLPLAGAGAMREVGAIAELENANAFLGRAASRARFVVEASRSSLIHFGGHSSPPTDGLDSGGLAFLGSHGEESVLTYPEIAGLDLAGASVVLLGCDTAREAHAEAAPALASASLAQAFLRAGSRNVVGSLWPIESAAAREFAETFYRAGGPRVGASALATAKRTLRRRYPNEPLRWAGAVWQGAPNVP